MFTFQYVIFHKNTFPYFTISYSDSYDQPPFPLPLEYTNDEPTPSSKHRPPNPPQNNPTSSQREPEKTLFNTFDPSTESSSETEPELPANNRAPRNSLPVN